MKKKQKMLVFVLEGASNEMLDKLGAIMNKHMPEIHCVLMSQKPELYLLDKDKLFNFVEKVRKTSDKITKSL